MDQSNSENEQSDETSDVVYSLMDLNGALFAARASGLYISLDCGQTWQNALADQPLSGPLPALALAVSSPVVSKDRTSQVLLAGVPGGIFRSGDGGLTWKAILLPHPPPTITTLASTSQANGSIVFFAGSSEDGVFISRDGGESWASWNFGLLDLNVACIGVSPNFSVDETVFAGTETGLFHSTNGGRAWRDINLPFGFEDVLCLAVSPRFADDHTLYIGTETQGLWVSGDEGSNWQQCASFDAPINALLLGDNPNEILAITSDELWRSTDSGQTWAKTLPQESTDLQISAVLPTHDFGSGESLFLGLVDGSVISIKLL
jgi:photosystem II stability/assembly factor-like uncharacterized protein